MAVRVQTFVRAVVVHPDEPLVLTVDGALPRATSAKSVHDGEGVPELFADLVKGPLRFARKLAYTEREAEPERWDVNATFALFATTPEAARGAWTPPTALPSDEATLADAALRFDDRVPWWRRGWFDDALAWADGALATLGEARVAEPEFLRSWQISALYRLRTNRGERYLKAVPEFFSREGRVTRWLHALLPEAAPAVLAARGDTLFLMGAAGTRKFEKGDAFAVARLFARVQRLAEARLDELRALGCEDRLLGALAGDVEALLDDEALLRAGGILRDDEVSALRAARAPFRAACERLAVSPIHTTLVHGDAHSGNVVLNGDVPTLLDWSDAALSFPFLDVSPAYFLGTRSDLSARAELSDAYLQAWTDVLPLPELRALHADAVVAGELYRAVSYVKFIAPHVPDPAEWADAHVWHLRRALEFLNAPTATRDAAAGTD